MLKSVENTELAKKNKINLFNGFGGIKFKKSFSAAGCGIFDFNIAINAQRQKQMRQITFINNLEYGENETNKKQQNASNN